MTYFILHKWDEGGKTLSLNKDHHEIYDAVTYASTISEARKVAFAKLHERPIVVKEFDPSQRIPQSGKYIVAAYFPTKYGSQDYGGGFDYVPTHEVARCERAHLSGLIEKLVAQQPSKLLVGIEQKLL